MEQNGTQLQFMICVKNNGSEDLSLHKVYQVLPDTSAFRNDYVRVIDDSGEDYLYPAEYFIRVEVPVEAERVLLVAA